MIVPSMRARRAAPSRGAGFTLIELLVTIALLAILMSLAAPSFMDAAVSAKVSDNANRLASTATLARGEAIKRNGIVAMCTSANGTTCASTGGWEQGWLVFHDLDRDGVLDAGETILSRGEAAPGGYLISESANKRVISFQPTSVGTTTANWTVCRAVPSVNSQQREVTVGATGRSAVTRKTGTTCS